MIPNIEAKIIFNSQKDTTFTSDFPFAKITYISNLVAHLIQELMVISLKK